VVDSLDRAVLRVHQFRCLKTAAEPASETSWFVKNEAMDKVPKRKILSVRHIPSSEPHGVELKNAFR
jgi:hypothetical protein